LLEVLEESKFDITEIGETQPAEQQPNQMHVCQYQNLPKIFI
jgi:hypothetical protein